MQEEKKQTAYLRHNFTYSHIVIEFYQEGSCKVRVGR